MGPLQRPLAAEGGNRPSALRLANHDQQFKTPVARFDGPTRFAKIGLSVVAMPQLEKESRRSVALPAGVFLHALKKL